ncbi:unnamed protein product [Paramecium primaurelia]|uniref:Kinase domain protein n=1 Tax=Paramecium primaurelia TaxID=5886 RepID=A0A8S1M7R8_PARPR|nr:unnamed protein product [Paramecium primaurelia]
MTLSHTIQHQEDIQCLKSETLQIVIQTSEQVVLDKIECKNLTLVVEGFLNYQHYSTLISSLNHLDLSSFKLKYGANNQFSDEDGKILAQFILNQKSLKSLDIHFDLNNPIKQISPVLEAIQNHDNELVHLKLNFEDELPLCLKDLQFITSKKLQSISLQIGQGVCVDQNWSHFEDAQKDSILQEFTLLISPFNKLDKSFHSFFKWLASQPNIEKLNISIGAQTEIDEQAITQLGLALQKIEQLKFLNLFLHDTRNLTQNSFDQIVKSFGKLENLELNLGNNYGINNYDILYQQVKNIKQVKLSLGTHHKFISSELFQDCNIKILDIKLQKGSTIKQGSFKSIEPFLERTEKLLIELSEGKDCSDLDLIDLIGQITPGCDIRITTNTQQIRKIKQTLQIQLDTIQSIKILFNTLSQKMDLFQNLKIFIKSTSIEQESVDSIIKQLQQSQLKVLSLIIKKINNFQCNQMIDLFQQIVVLKQWTFLSIEVVQKCIMQLYGKSLTNQQVNFQVHSGLKLGSQGMEYIAKSLKSINITKLRLTILLDNSLNEQGLKQITLALLNSVNLQKASLQILDSNQQLQQYMSKMQATINQYIKDKTKLQKSYCLFLQKELNNNKKQISQQMLAGVADYLIEDVVLPVPAAGQYHNQQGGFGSSWNPQQIVEIFGQ